MMMWTIDARSKHAKGVGPNKLLVKHITYQKTVQKKTLQGCNKVRISAMNMVKCMYACVCVLEEVCMTQVYIMNKQCVIQLVQVMHYGNCKLVI